MGLSQSNSTNVPPSTRSGEKPCVSIIIPFRNEERTIEQSVLSLAERVHTAPIEILAIDDGSTDASVQIVKRLTRTHNFIKVLTSNGSGEAATRNIGVVASQGQVIVQFSAHAVAADNFLDVLLSKLKASPLDVAGVGCTHVAAGGEGWSSALGVAMRTAFGGFGTTYHQHGSERYVESVAYAAYKAKIFAEIGVFDPAIPRGVDSEFNLRLSRAGYRLLYTPTTTVFHHEVSSPRVFFGKLVGLGAARMKIIRKYPWSFRPVYSIPSFALLVSILLGTGSIFDTRLAVALLGLLVVYVCCSFFAATRIANKAGFKQTVRTLLAFPLMHVGYGIGFIKELIRPS